uniref:RING-type domain-containing protein n=1 Tax=Salvator merianae TaxID=96440 RepID=A0A8D0BY89_SALMN
MASAPLSVVCGEQAPICSICKDLFSNPKILSCGHSFCNACLLQHWEDSEAEPPCPRCGELFQESDIKPNKRLANLVHELTQRQEEEKAKDAEQEWRKGDIAERKEGKGVENCGRGLPNSPQDLGSVSGDILDMGLEDSSSCIAPTCKEKVQEVQALVLAFQETRQELMDWKVAEEKRSKECLDRLAAEEQKIRGIFEEMQNILLNKEQWLSQLEGLKRLIEKKEEENATRFPKEIYCLDDSIVKLNNIYEMPASEFLEGIRMNLSKYQKRCQPQLLELSPEVNERLRSFSEENSLLKEAIRKFKVLQDFPATWDGGESKSSHLSTFFYLWGSCSLSAAVHWKKLESRTHWAAGAIHEQR